MTKRTRLSVGRKEIWNITFPIIFGNLAQTLIALTDTAFLGRVSAVALGASMMAGIYYFIYGTIAWGFAVGVQILIARRLGEDKLDRIGVIFQHGALTVLFLGLGLFMILHFSTHLILSNIVSSPNILRASLTFMDYRHWGIFFVCFNYLFRYLFIGLSQTKVITYSTAIMAGVNIVLDYGFIFGKLGLPEMGIAGAALASVIAEITAFLFFIYYIFNHLPLVKYGMSKLHKIETWILWNILRLSLPTMIQKLVSFGTWFLFFAFVEHMGELPIAVSGIIRSVYMLLGIPVFAFGATSNTVVSRLIGAGKGKEVFRTCWKICGQSFFSIIPLVGFALFFPTLVLSIYTNDTLLIAEGTKALYTLCVGVCSMVIAVVFFEAISGTGNTVHALILETIVLVFYLSAIAIFASLPHARVEIVWFAESVYGGVMGILSVLFIRYYHWQNKII